MTRPALPAPAGAWAAVRAVCFDLGGTLVQVGGEPTTGQVAGALGITLEDARRYMEAGAKRRRTGPGTLARQIAAEFGRPDAAGPVRAILSAARDRAQSPPLFPDAEPVLRQLRARGFGLYALTNCLGSSVPDREPDFHRLLDAVICSADTGWCKPEPQAFAAVEERSGLRPGQLLHVGDSARADAAGAAAAGWHAAYLDRPGSPRTPPPGPAALTLATLRDLTVHLPVLD